MQAFFMMAGSEQAGLSPDGMGLNGMTGVLNYRYSHAYRINAGDIGGGRDGNPRQSNIFRITSGGLTAQRILIVLPHLLHLLPG